MREKPPLGGLSLSLSLFLQKVNAANDVRGMVKVALQPATRTHFTPFLLDLVALSQV
jgi:hypothetical protein